MARRGAGGLVGAGCPSRRCQGQRSELPLPPVQIVQARLIATYTHTALTPTTQRACQKSSGAAACNHPASSGSPCHPAATRAFKKQAHHKSTNTDPRPTSGSCSETTLISSRKTLGGSSKSSCSLPYTRNTRREQSTKNHTTPKQTTAKKNLFRVCQVDDDPRPMQPLSFRGWGFCNDVVFIVLHTEHTKRTVKQEPHNAKPDHRGQNTSSYSNVTVLLSPTNS